MRRNSPYGRAYKISESDAKAYERTTRPRKYKANPMGVTAMASVNGRGSYQSARAVSAGRTKAEREARARQVMRNGEKKMATKRAGFLKNRISRKPTSRDRAASASKQKRVLAAEKAAKTRARNKRKAAAAAPAAPKKTAKKSSSSKRSVSTTQRRGGKRLAAYMSAKRSGKSEKAAKASALRKVPLKVGDKFKGSVGKSKRKTATKASRTVGASKGRTYERVYMTDPKTGKKRLSYMYKDKGKKRKIPTKKIISSGYRSADQVAKARRAAAEKILKSGGVFVPNKSRSQNMKKNGTAKQKRAGRRLAAYMAAKRSGKGVTAAKAAAIKKVPLAAGDTFKGSTKGGTATKKRRTKRRKVAGVAKGTKRTTTKRRKATTKRKTTHKPKRKTTAKRRTAKRSYRKVTGVVHCAPVKRKKATKRRSGKLSKAQRSAAAKKAARTRKRNARSGYKRNGKNGYIYSKTSNPRVIRRRKRSMKKNNFMAKLKDVLLTGVFVAGGFLSHKVLTGLAIQGIDKMAPTMFASASAANWKKPAMGFATLLVGIPLARALLKKNATEVTAGMAASWIQSVIVSSLNAANKPEWAGHLSGYSNSRAYSLRGPVERHAVSTMPQYARLSGFNQAAAGFNQAAAGTGEYFQANATGEYFAPDNLQGVGSYEAAGSLALQAAAGGQDIDDGIRPDSDIDGLMDLAEAAAGLRGMGEFYSAVQAGGGRVVEKRVGTHSEWIPNGPLWAGTDAVKDTQATSELSAGILQRGGGNGSLSA